MSNHSSTPTATTCASPPPLLHRPCLASRVAHTEPEHTAPVCYDHTTVPKRTSCHALLAPHSVRTLHPHSPHALIALLSPIPARTRCPTLPTHSLPYSPSFPRSKVRCIKPNAERQPLAFDEKLTLEQLRYSGVFEAVSIRKHGYPFRLVHRHFANRYRCLVAAEVAQEAALEYSTAYDRPRDACEALLRLLSAKEMKATQSSSLGGIKVGKRRVFYRSVEHRILEAGREREVRRIVVAVQAALRGVRAKQVRRMLAQARNALQVAVVRKKLEPLDAALELARAPHKIFSGSEHHEFTLFVPHQAEVDTLRANLVREIELEVRPPPSISTCAFTWHPSTVDGASTSTEHLRVAAY